MDRLIVLITYIMTISIKIYKFSSSMMSIALQNGLFTEWLSFIRYHLYLRSFRFNITSSFLPDYCGLAIDPLKL